MQDTAIQAVKSVLDQKISANIIIVDDGSTPKISLPDSFLKSNLVSLVRLEQNQGPSAARNAGVKTANTAWISFLDADDTLVPNTLKQRLAFAVCDDENNETNKPRLYGCGWIECAENGEPVRQRIPHDADRLTQFSSGCWYAPGSCLIVRRDILIQTQFREDLKRCEDFELGIRLGKAGASLRVDPTIGAKIYPGYRTNYSIIDENLRRILALHIDLQKENPPAWRNLIGYANLELSKQALRQKRLIQFVYHGLKSLVARPRTTIHLSPGWLEKRF